MDDVLEYTGPYKLGKLHNDDYSLNFEEYERRVKAYRKSLQARSKTKFYIDGDVSIGVMRNGTEFIFDTDMLEYVAMYTWYLTPNGYVATKSKYSLSTYMLELMGDLEQYFIEDDVGYMRTETDMMFLHRYILGLYDSKITVDHIKGNKLDNRRCALRMCTLKENVLNRKYRNSHPGVKQTKSGKWKATIRLNGITTNLGVYETFDEALIRRQEAEIDMFGQYSRSESEKVYDDYIPSGNRILFEVNPWSRFMMTE